MALKMAISAFFLEATNNHLGHELAFYTVGGKVEYQASKGNVTSVTRFTKPHDAQAVRSQ